MNIKTLTQKYSKYVMVLVIGLLVGGLTMNMVHASIPDSNGSIHGCRNTLTTMLRVIDSASQSCGSDESALNWDQDGVKGYAHIVYNGSTNSYTIDSARSKNVSNIFNSTDENPNPVCLTASFTPRNISVTDEGGAADIHASIKDAGGWTNGSSYCDVLGTGANINVTLEWRSSFFVTLY